MLRGGTIVDATLIHAPSSTKNKDKKRDGEMSSTKKGSNYHFGMKVHTGTDSQSGLVHTVKVTTASVHDKQEMDELLGTEKRKRCLAIRVTSATRTSAQRERRDYSGVCWTRLRAKSA